MEDKDILIEPFGYIEACIEGGIVMRDVLPNQPGASCLLARAKTMIVDSMRLLDEADAPADIAAHLDTAVSRLDEIINPGS